MMKRPCFLVMDSLNLSSHEDVCKHLRDYLQVEWEVRKCTPRLFTQAAMPNIACRVRQQDNGYDCGLYLLQYVESFLQNPVVHFGSPIDLQGWFLRKRVRQKRQKIRRLILQMHREQKQKESDTQPP
ncbi:sentrin-specific protease 7 [Thalassophryne amazonica]|uniref:sentrin-specific protease 7 n=1 Tax=Thalassophryne amazonica TaxID=390379 RepID=UPI001470C31D|nr:sentrin-specific protease 7 [Thalassophryne amazonica]